MAVFLEKIKKISEKATVKAYLSGEEAGNLAKKAANLEKKKNKTEEESKQVKELREEAERLREQQEQARNITKKLSLGEKIVKLYFTYKFASLACKTLVGLAGGYAYQNQGYAMANAVTNGIETMSDKLADKIDERAAQAENPDQVRAQMIEETLESFERISQDAQEQGLTPEDEPLLTDEDREKIQGLADISRDSDNSQQAEQYAAKCKELGLDYNEAMDAFQKDKTFDEVKRDIEIENEQKIKSEIPTCTHEI